MNALNIGKTKTYKGKHLSQDAVLWVQAKDMK
jgi:cobalt/nickel transport protein